MRCILIFSPFQIIDQTSADSEPIIALIVKGTDLISHSVGLSLCALSAAILMYRSSADVTLSIFFVIGLSVC